MIPTDHFYKLLDILAAIKSQYNAYKRTQPAAINDHVFIEEIRKLAHEIEYWCDNSELRKW